MVMVILELCSLIGGNKPNMLNVAVSRAKDNFIVFANTKILDKSSKSPSGILANHLKYEVIRLS